MMSRILTEFLKRTGRTLKNNDEDLNPMQLQDLAAECLQSNGLESNLLDEKCLELSKSSRAELIMVIYIYLYIFIYIFYFSMFLYHVTISII